ncbi:MAG: hypothetical protein KAS93_08105 [Gammaproteobacteria bacterium]|nr:hypothetical protein [Gammaproteobacteria bacterium]
MSRKDLREEETHLRKRGLKKCSTCKVVKSFDEFYNNKAQRDGKGNTCKQCQNASNKSAEEKCLAPKRAEKAKHVKIRKCLLKEGYKNCSKCGKIKKVEAFNKAARNNDGLHAWCRDCQSTINEERYEDIRPKDRPRAIVFTSDKEREDAQREQGRKCHATPVLFETFWRRIPVTDVPSPDENEKLTVICKACKNRFVPTRNAVKNRINAFNNDIRGESNFYCSDKCRDDCPVYRFNPYQSIDPRSKNYVRPSEQAEIRNCQTDHLKQLQCDEQGYNYCERCGDIIDVELHHTQEVKHGNNAVNSAGHLLLCAGCHTLTHDNC